MPTIEPYAARGVYDPPIYAQAVKVSGAQTILYIAGQVAYTPEGGAAHAGDFKGQARAALQCLKAQVEAGGHAGRGSGAGAARIPDRDRGGRGAVGPARLGSACVPQMRPRWPGPKP